MKPVMAEVVSDAGGIFFKATEDKPAGFKAGDKIVIVPAETWDAMVMALRGAEFNECRAALKAAGVAP